MVYAGSKGEDRVTLGVSGRLMDSNLVMWDAETGSLWSQILGKALQGDREGVELDLLPAVFVGLGTWKRLHPKTGVLDLEPVRATNWFYTADDLARGWVRGRGGRKDLGIGLRHGAATLCVPLQLVHDRMVVEVEVDGIPLAVVWHAAEKAAVVYDRRVEGGGVVALTQRDGVLVAAGGKRWNALSGKPLAGGAVALRRFPYLPTFVVAWRTYYPDGQVLEH